MALCPFGSRERERGRPGSRAHHLCPHAAPGPFGSWGSGRPGRWRLQAPLVPARYGLSVLCDRLPDGMQAHLSASQRRGRGPGTGVDEGPPSGGLLGTRGIVRGMREAVTLTSGRSPYPPRSLRLCGVNPKCPRKRRRRPAQPRLWGSRLPSFPGKPDTPGSTPGFLC